MGAASTYFASEDSHTIAAGQILRTLRARWWWPITGGVIGLALGIVGASQMIRTYTATGHIVVDSKSFSIPELQGAISNEGSQDPMPAVTTAAIGMRSPALLQSVVSELHLTESPYFNANLRAPTILDQIMNDAYEALDSLFSTTSKQTQDETALAALELAKRLTIFTDNKSFDVSASVVLPDPVLATRIVNVLMDRYIADRGAVRAQVNVAANTAVTQLLDKVRGEVDELESQARDLRAKNELVVLPAGSLGQQQLSELGTAQAKAAVERQQLEAKLKRATELSRQGNSAELADVLSSPTMALLRERQATAAGLMAKTQSNLRPDSSLGRGASAEYHEVQAKLTDEINRIVKSLPAQVGAARDREAAATQALQNASAAAAKASRIQAEIARVEREAASRRTLYQSLLERASQTSLSPDVAKVSPGVHVDSPAVVPPLPSGPHTKIVAGLGLLAGLILGSTFAVKRGNNGPSSAGTLVELAAHLRLPLLAVLPIPQRRRARLANDTMQPVPSLAKEDGGALRLLYLRLRHQATQQAKELRSLLFLASDGENASAIARNFAELAIREGERVLLIDVGGGIKQTGPQIGHKENYGLEAVLQGQRAWRDVVIQDDASRINAIAAHNQPLESIDRIASVRLRSMLQEADDYYTLIIIVAEHNAQSLQATHLAQVSDFTLLLINPGETSLPTLTASVDNIKTASGSLGLAALARRVA